jgi:CheY-like chemotaxis protein
MPTGNEMQKQRTILYVEDEQSLMQGYIDALSVDYFVLEASDVDQALEILAERGDAISLILLDVMMPPGRRIPSPDRGRTSGLVFARLILQDQKLSIPIVCLTGVTDPSVHDELAKIGVKEVVSKYVLPSQLKEILGRHINPGSMRK